MVVPDFAKATFEPENLRQLLSRRSPLVDQPLSIDKVTLAIGFDRLNFRKALCYLKGKPWMTLKKTPHNWRIFVHGELLFELVFISNALRAIVYDMWRHGVFWSLPEDEPYTSQIEPSDYLFTFVTIAELEIAFDFQSGQVPESLLNRAYTLYGKDYVRGGPGKRGRHSGFYAYNRIRSLKAKNQHSHARIDLLRYSYRGEFLLTSRRCPYLNLQNLDGHVYQIVERFLPYLQSQVASADFPAEFRAWNLDNEHQEIADTLFNYIWPREKGPHLKLTSNWNREMKQVLLLIHHWL